MVVEHVDQALEAATPATQVQMQLLADGFNQFHRRQPRIEHQRNLGIFRQLLQQQPAERGLAGTDLAGELDKTAAATLADAIQQVRQGIAVALGQIDEARIRRDRERRSEEHTSELQSLMRISYAVLCLK